MRKRFFFFTLFSYIAFIVYAPAAIASVPVVADISTYRVAIDSGFTGIRVFIFGARNDTGDVVVVIRGPKKNFVVRKKEPVAGIWVNRDYQKFKDVPQFYAVAAVRPLEELGADRLLKQLGIGQSTVLHTSPHRTSKADHAEFAQAFYLAQESKELYQHDLKLNFMGETLFKTVIPFPDTIPRGHFTAEVYLISDGRLEGMQTLPIRVEKTGLDAAVYDLAHQHSLLYGLLAIAIALAAGWVASRLFQKR